MPNARRFHQFAYAAIASVNAGGAVVEQVPWARFLYAAFAVMFLFLAIRVAVEDERRG